MTEFNNKKRKFPVLTILKNIWRREGQKAKERKKTHTKKPPGYRSRALGRAVFWVMFIFMFIVVIANIFSGEKVESKSQDVKIKENKAATQEAVQYAKNFTAQYFTWQKGEDDTWIEDRQNRLRPFIARGIDENVGLDVSKMEWDSKVDKMNLVEIEKKDNNKAFITLYVSSIFTKKTKVQEVIKKDGKEEKKEVEKEETKPFVQYFVVPIAYQNKTYGVYQLPHYTNVKEQTSVKLDQREGLREYTGNRRKVEDFLNTFFTTYAQDDSNKLSFMLQGNTQVEALNGKMKFVAVEGTDIKKDKDGNIQTFSTVKLQDEKTGAIVNSNYSLVVTNKQGRFLVKKINQ